MIKIKRYGDTLKEQLIAGGVRLAWTLEEIFGSNKKRPFDRLQGNKMAFFSEPTNFCRQLHVIWIIALHESSST